jgi:hypothetical protein
VQTFKRDYVSVHEPHDAETVLAQLGQWFDDYPSNSHPHLSSESGSRSPYD